MNTEIERKFLVKGDFMPYVIESKKIVQGYISKDPYRIVRVRIINNRAFLTIKGITTGISRYEWEYEINVDDALELMKLCKDKPISKTRYIIPIHSNLQFEVDVFHEHLNNLVIAEIELPDADTTFKHPEWLGEEVTGDERYYNSNL